jgi:two-component system sensor histidine kinase DesK
MTETKSNSPNRQKNWAFVWLFYTGFLFIDPILEPSLNLWLGTLTVLAIFLAIFWRYVLAADAGSPVRHWMIVATFLLGLATYPWNTGATTFFVYAAAFLPFSIESVRRVITLFFVEASLVLLEGWIFHNASHAFRISWPNTIIAIFLMAVIGGGNIFFAQQKRADCKLREAQAENMALAAVAERERIARDLHDVLGHTLSVIVLKAELANRLIERDPRRASTETQDIERIARTALAEVREAIGGYRARGLAAEIEAARLTLDAAGVTLVTDSEPTAAASLSAAEETALALALREAVTNIVRHARATTCKLRFISPSSPDSGPRRLIIEDNGQHAQVREGSGLRGMRERLEALGGNVSLEREGGTRLLIDLPLRAGEATS